MDSPAIKNLEYLRMLIAAARQAANEDAERLRMLRYPDTGTSMLTVSREDR
jgi:hypothetical protein